MNDNPVSNPRIHCRFGIPGTYHSDRLSWWQANAALWAQYLQANQLRMELLRSIAAKTAELAAGLDRHEPRIADLGCGEGQFLRLTRECIPAAQLHGVDFSSAMLEEARRRSVSSSITFNLADIELHDADLPADQDVVVSVLSLDEMAEIDIAFQNLAKAIRPKGWLLVVTLDPMHELLRHWGEISRQPHTDDDGDAILIEKHFLIGDEMSPYPYCRIIRNARIYNAAGTAHGLKSWDHYRWSGKANHRADPIFEVSIFQKQ